MPSELADYIDGTPGRFVPEEMRGELIEAEHLVRYWWAASMASGRRVLDAGCGLGYGSALLSEGGAASVDAIDIGGAVVQAAQARVGDAVRFATGDVRALPFAEDSFDLLVCLEVLEHVDDQAGTLDEFRRVLAPGGILVISSPNRDAYVPGNPHHVREYTPGELETELGQRWDSVRLVRQHNFLATTLLDDRDAAVGGGAPIASPEVRKLEARKAGAELYTVALAGDGEVPEARPFIALASTAEVRVWLERFEGQQRVLESQADALTELAQTVADREDLLKRLSEGEAVLQRQPALEARLKAAESGQQRLAVDIDNLRRRAEEAERGLEALQASFSWRVTRPLRVVKRLLR